MEAAFNHKSLERVVSQRAYQMSISFPCQICVVGFFCGICLTTLFMAALTSLGGISNSNISSSLLINAADGECNNKLVKQEEKVMYYPSEGSEILAMDEKVTTLYSLWSDLLSKSTSGTSLFSKKIQLSKSINVPKAPHLEDCKASVGLNLRLDRRIHNGSFPPWTIWKGTLDELSPSTDDEQLRRYRNRMISEGAYPPWIEGSDEDNYPFTRKVQRDIWLHQHPSDCRDSNVKFLVADWERLPGFGIGAQIAGMSGLLSIAIKEGRVLVTNYFNRADHDGCQGTPRSSWSCYFFPETSQECRERAFELIRDRAALDKGVITVKENYTSKEIWSGPTPRVWGSPWSIMQPTTEINGSLLIRHRKMDRRWWRAQAVRYLMRFQSEYTCNLMNIARHDAFGREAARMVLESSARDPLLTQDVKQEMSDIERYAWSNSKPWIPRPLLSMHVRMGDKACEMKVVGFDEYMNLGQVLRRRFPQLKHVWLSTEMQDVIDRSKSYRNWRFYYTNVTRQTGNSTMATYEANLGRETSTNYPMVNFLMASEADFFVGALGSTWCFLIDGMRNTGGKVMSGYLSVNKDRFW